MRTVDTLVGKYGVTRHNLWSRPPSIQSSSALALEFLWPQISRLLMDLSQMSHKWVTDESYMGYTLECISHLLPQAYQSLVPSPL